MEKIILIISLMFFTSISQGQNFTSDSVLSIYKKSSLEKFYLSIDKYNLKDIGAPDSGYNEIEINKFVKDTFEFIYHGDFNGNGKKDFLTGLNIDLGCNYQFFLFDYETNKQAKQVLKLNPECPFYSYLIPRGNVNEFTYYFIKNQEKKTIDSVEVVMCKGELLSKKLVQRKTRKLKTFTIKLKTVNSTITYEYKKNILTKEIIRNGGEKKQHINKDIAEFIIHIISKLDFQSIEKRNTNFDDAPSLNINIEYKRAGILEFSDLINFFTGGSLYYSIDLSTLYRLLYPEQFKEDY